MAEQRELRPSGGTFVTAGDELRALRAHAQERMNEKREAFVQDEHGRAENENQEISPEEQERAAADMLAQYAKIKPEDILSSELKLPQETIERLALELEPEAHDAQMDKFIKIIHERGVRNALSVVEAMKNPHIEDDFHRVVVRYLANEFPITDIKEYSPLWRVLNMTLYEVVLPEAHAEGDDHRKTLKELLSSMEQFYEGMLSVSEGSTRGNPYFTLELALPHVGSEAIFYAAVPNHKRDVFEKQLLAIFPHARLEARANDYNIFNEHGVSIGADALLSRDGAFPFKTYDAFDYDPLNIVVNAFSKIAHEGEGAAIQLVFRPTGDMYLDRYRKVAENIRRGVKTEEAVRSSTASGAVHQTFRDLFFKQKKPEPIDEEDMKRPPQVDQIAIDEIQEKIKTPIVAVNLRLLVSAGDKERAETLLAGLESTFNQFQNTQGNRFRFDRPTRGSLEALVRQFIFREFSTATGIPLSLREISTVFHFPPSGTISSPHLRQSKAGLASAPLGIPTEGVLLGTNRYRTTERQVYIPREDRLRHFYAIGQTGTGKSSLLKNMIIHDIVNGDGVCYIDPHGSDIIDILGMIPEERIEDVIYFDPSHIEHPFALNMLEFDMRFPEQKTFVVNELLSIFNKLFDMKTVGGPMFEQYFRNAVLLIIDDPSAPSTLLDVSRVLSDKTFRAQKLATSTNPVVVQFWRDVAEKAGGEAALANIVPYITSKFDAFLSNDIIRPIIAQAHSSIRFREIMDDQKILLVNLSKGRLGDINANLLGLIIVGKILMAALSRVDAIGHESVPPDFYLYIDEFQNITTDSVVTILSEARKYRLGLHVAHQFIAQLTEHIRDAVFGNVGTIAAFRVGAEDAEFLAKQFAPVFGANDLMNLDNRFAYLRLLAHGRPIKPFHIETAPLPPMTFPVARIDRIKNLSYSKFGRNREEVEQEIRLQYAPRPEAALITPATQ